MGEQAPPTTGRMTMAAKKKPTPLDAAQAEVVDLVGQQRAARARVEQATAHLTDLESRNSSGDQTVTGLDLISARGDVETAEGLLRNAERLLSQAQAEAAALLAGTT